MPSLHHLNPPPHPFWDFVANLDDHPFFAAYAPRNQNSANTEQAEGVQQQTAPQSSENARGKQPAAEDPPVVDPSTITPEAAPGPVPGGFPTADHGFGGFGFEGFGCGWNPAGAGRQHGSHGFVPDGRRGHGCRGRRGFGGRGGPFGGGPGFMTGPPPFWTGPRHHSRPHGHHHHHHHHQEQESATRPSDHNESGRSPVDQGVSHISKFLNDLGDKLGIDLAGAAENFGLDKYSAPNVGEDVDFEPRTDIFDTASHYVIHLSLPGAKKQDVGVDWDGEHSILRITGVVHRPDVDEQMLNQLVVNGRKRENGVFEKAIRLGTKRDPANVDVAGITAKMTDGVLIVKVPKTEPEIHKREVPISGSASPSPAVNEKDLLFDADEEMYDAPRRSIPAATTEVSVSEKEAEKPSETKEKEAEAREDRSVTAGREEEHLPAYAAHVAGEEDSDKMSDWEKDSEDEADYVKIHVD